MSKVIVVRDFDFGTVHFKAGDVLDSANGDPISALQADNMPVVTWSSSLAAKAAALAASAFGSGNSHVGDAILIAAMADSTATPVGAIQAATDLSSNTSTLPAKWRRRVHVWQKNAVDGAANTATAELPFYRAQDAETISAIYVVPVAA